MNILFLLPWEEDYRLYRGRFSRYLTYAPLTLVALAALVPAHYHANIDICDEMHQTVDKSKHYDIVAISFVTPSSYRAYRHADFFRQRGSHIVFGGYHTTFVPEEAVQHADSIVIGAAEGVFQDFLADYIAGKARRIYRQDCQRTLNYAVPRRDLLAKSGYLNIPAVIANPGCPNACEYCAISALNRAQPRPVGDVIAEIKSLNRNRLIFFDPNFFYNREYVQALMGELAKLKVKWACNATVKMAFDDELLELAQHSGCSGVLLGLESLNCASLKRVHKAFNDPTKYKEAILRLQAHDISVNGCFVLGFDSDRAADLRTLPEQVDYLGLNLARYAILTPVPGSKLFKRLDQEGRIISRDWRDYTQNKAVFTPAHMTAEELERIYRQVWRETYRLSAVWKRTRSAATLEMKALVLGANIGFKYVADHV